MDINTQIHGEMNAWYTLAFALLQLGKLKQVEKVFRVSCFEYFRNLGRGKIDLLLSILSESKNRKKQALKTSFSSVECDL